MKAVLPTCPRGAGAAKALCLQRMLAQARVLSAWAPSAQVSGT